MKRPASMFKIGTFILLGLVHFAAVYQPLLGQGVIATIAGGSKIFPNGPTRALDAAVVPVGIVVSNTGDIYFSDQPSNTVLKLARDGKVTIVAGNGIAGFSGDGGPATLASLSLPFGLALDRAGSLYIADSNNHRIRRVTADGAISTVAGSGQGGFSGDGGPATAARLAFPSGVAVDPGGNLLIADRGNIRVRRVTPDGLIATIAGNGTQVFGGDGGPAQNATFIFPEDIATDTRGAIYVADGASGTIRRIDPAGTITTIAGNRQFGYAGDGGPAVNATLAIPRAVSVDTAGNVYFSDSAGNRIRRITPSGTISTVLGTGNPGFGGDGGKGVSAPVAAPLGTAIDAAGNVYVSDTDNRRIRKLDTAGIVTTIVGNGQSAALNDGRPSTDGALSAPGNLALDRTGNLYIVDQGNQRVRQVKTNGVIVTLAGNGTIGFSGDGGPATSAALCYPSGVATDATGNVYIADRCNHRIRRVSPLGVITTVAGNGQAGFLGDGGQATAAALSYPSGVAVDSSGNLYISDSGNQRVRRVTPSGIITTFAGTGKADFSGDGGQATSAAFNNPTGLAADSSGNLYIADSANNRVRVVNRAGVVSTFAGNNVGRYSGDGGPAVNAAFTSPTAVAVDPAGNIYIADQQNSRIRRVNVNGIVNTVAGTGESGYAGDGGLAVNAKIQIPGGVGLDAAGNLYIGDRDNNRVRIVLANAPSFTVEKTTMSFTAAAGGAAPPGQRLTLASQVSNQALNATGLGFAASSGGSAWVQVTPDNGSMPASLSVEIDPSALSPGSYTGTITVTAALASPATRQVTVNLTVTEAQPPSLSINTPAVNFGVTLGASPTSQDVTIANKGGSSLSFTAIASGGDWLNVSPGSGIATPDKPSTVTITGVSGSLPVGTYSGTVLVSSSTSGEQSSIPVVLTVTAARSVILISQTGLTFQAVSKGGTPLPQGIGILNTGQGSMEWQAEATTLSGGSWLSISSSKGTVSNPFLDVSPFDVSVKAADLSPGDYYGSIRVTSPSADNSPQTISVVLSVAPAGSNPGPEVRPTGLIFVGPAGSRPGSQNVRISNLTGAPTTFASSQTTIPAGESWLSYVPSSTTINPDQPLNAVVQVDLSNLRPGAQRGVVTFLFSDGSVRNLSLLTVVAPTENQAGKQETRLAGSCTPKNLYVVFTQLGGGVSIAAGWPVTIEARVVDDCGAPMTTGAVTASFSNGDPLMPLVHLQNGVWTGTWQPGSLLGSSVIVSLKAQQKDSGLSATARSTTAVQVTQTVPVISGRATSAAGLAQGPVAPGELVLLQGTGLADGSSSSTSAPLAQELAGTSVLIGGRQASLVSADSTRVVGLVPFDLPINTQTQILLQGSGRIGVPSPVSVAAAHPAIFSKDGSGQGQGLIYLVNDGLATTLADSSNPVAPGDQIAIYCAGLGALNQQGELASPVSVTVGGQSATVISAGAAVQDKLPPDGPPTLLQSLSTLSSFVGLYRIDVRVPAGTPDGEVALKIDASGQSSQPGIAFRVITR